MSTGWYSVTDYVLDPLRYGSQIIHLLISSSTLLELAQQWYICEWWSNFNSNRKLIVCRHEETHNRTSKYKIGADTFRGQLNSHPRTTQGQFWHKLKYPNQGMLFSISSRHMLSFVWFWKAGLTGYTWERSSTRTIPPLSNLKIQQLGVCNHFQSATL